MSYIPPFTITADILNLVASISEQVGQLIAPVNASVNAPVNIDGLKITKVGGKDLRTISRAISKLQQTNQLKRIGSDKTGYWEVQP